MGESVTTTDSLTYYKQCMKLEPVDANSYLPLVLAYIGDAVYELIIHARVINQGNMQANKMRKRSAQLVKALTQAALIRAVEELLTEEEHGVYKRGRNARPATTAKNASVIDYRTATGMGALVGWLSIKGEFKRLVHIVSQGLIRLGELPVESGADPAGRTNCKGRGGESTGETEETGDMR